MLKINLLPVKAARRSQMGKRQLLLFIVSIFVIIGLLVLIHSKYVKEDTSTLSQELATLKKKTQEVSSKTGDTSRYNKLEKRYQSRRNAYSQVLSGCYCRCSGEKKIVDCTSECGPTKRMLRFCPGPVMVMREISRVLSERWGPTLRKDLDPDRRVDYYNPNWDPTTLWITSFQEEGGVFRILGGAKANGDVAEFEKRLKVSKYFADVSVIKTSLVSGRQDELHYYQFELTGRVLY